jgi:hypothetical protein
MIPPDDALPLLVVEDSDEDYAARRWALRKVGGERPVRRCATGAELRDSLRRTGPYAPGGPVDVGQRVESLRDVTRYWFGCLILPDAATRSPAGRTPPARVPG